MRKFLAWRLLLSKGTKSGGFCRDSTEAGSRLIRRWANRHSTRFETQISPTTGKEEGGLSGGIMAIAIVTTEEAGPEGRSQSEPFSRVEWGIGNLNFWSAAILD